ncbi:hypothetical protein LWI29_013782 [Acer saccharum]|uniref:Uncharacterized protein n=1 Tax=Acer saccharum TaxID=4024 RepID=A0AA39TS98_ACESA|nr:hypothetical protein LWI29_013782 [Acer saccharum]
MQKVRNPNIREILEKDDLTEEQIGDVVTLFLQSVKKGTWKTQGWPKVWTDYAISKLALNAYSRVLAKRFQGSNISVNCFCPGFTQTSMTSGKGTHSADEAAQIGVQLMLLPPQELPTGQVLYRIWPFC